MTVPIMTIPEPEEVAERHRTEGADALSKVGNAAKTLDIGQDAGFSGGEAPPVVILPAAVPG